MTTISDFSSQYFVIDTNVVSHSGERIISDFDLYDGLRDYVADPVVHVGGGHFHLTPQRAVPADTIAIPKSLTHLDDEPVLVAKNQSPIEEFTM